MTAVLVIVIVVAFGWQASLWLWPLKTCPACGGTGRIHAPGGSPAKRVCRRCGGTREVRRFGARKAER